MHSILYRMCALVFVCRILARPFVSHTLISTTLYSQRSNFVILNNIRINQTCTHASGKLLTAADECTREPINYYAVWDNLPENDYIADCSI